MIKPCQSESWLHFFAYIAIYSSRSMRSIRAQHSDISHLEDHHLTAKCLFHNFPRTHAHHSQKCLGRRRVVDSSSAVYYYGAAAAAPANSEVARLLLATCEKQQYICFNKKKVQTKQRKKMRQTKIQSNTTHKFEILCPSNLQTHQISEEKRS